MSSTVILNNPFFVVSLKILILSCTGKRFYAHRIALLASSDAFRAMFDGGYRVSFEAWHNIMCFFWLEYVYLFS
jgi:hypothetical protein